jgi:hypothetical protein
MHSMAMEFSVDFAVLEHLRGYPDDLHRYANLMKQAHPRGQSAVAFLLGRPGSGDFVETVCRYVRDGVAIITAVAAAEAAGLPPRDFLDRVASREDFPAPLWRRDHRALWRRDEVAAYLRAWKERASS